MNKILKHPIFIIISLILIPTLILVFSLSKDPLFSLYSLFTGPFSNLYSFGNMLNKSSPLLLTSLGAFIALRSNSFNLGGEGQVYLGATISGALSIFLSDIQSPLTLFIIVIITLLATGFITWISAWLEMKYRVSGLISTYLISMMIIHICNYFITNPFLKDNSNILKTENIPEIYFLNKLLPTSSLSFGFVIAIIIASISSFLLKHTIWGFEFKISGRNRKFAKSMGIESNKYKAIGMTLSGMLHGAAGILLVLGSYHCVILDFHTGLGWNGLSSALLAGNNPLFTILTSLFYSYLDAGARFATITSDVTLELSTIIKSIIFFIISSRLIKEKFIKRSSN